MAPENGPNFVADGFWRSVRSKNGQRVDLWPCECRDDVYFLALQVGQVAQVDLLSVQHFMPQDAAAFSDLHLLQAQPAHRADAQTSRARSLMNFILVDPAVIDVLVADCFQAIQPGCTASRAVRLASAHELSTAR